MKSFLFAGSASVGFVLVFLSVFLGYGWEMTLVGVWLLVLSSLSKKDSK